MRDVYEALRARRKVAYTTVMTMMNILEQKGFLKKRREERAYLYQPARPRQQWTWPAQGPFFVTNFCTFAVATGCGASRKKFFARCSGSTLPSFGSSARFA